ncbi:hypothetical protein ACHAQJ_000827 [Trichoderma viride]
MFSLKSTLFVALGCASTVLATAIDRGYQLAVPVPCGEDAIVISHNPNSTEHASLEKRQCAWGGNFFADTNCNGAGSQFGVCIGGSQGCVLTNSVLPFGYQSIQASDLSCDIRIWLGDCSDSFSFGIPAGSTPTCYGGFGTAHGYSIQC